MAEDIGKLAEDIAANKDQDGGFSYNGDIGDVANRRVFIIRRSKLFSEGLRSVSVISCKYLFRPPSKAASRQTLTSGSSRTAEQ